VVIGYGTQKKSDLTGSISTVSAKDFQKGQISSPEQLIMGKVPGVQITTSGGQPGAGSTIRIRTGASLNASNDPLIVVDGIPLAGGSVSGVANPLSLINPNDIETFTILKDANATAIYGSRASNGVILITTKKGNRSGTQINFYTEFIGYRSQ
jgi:iron complex outermembrane receptor protein